MPTGNDFHWQTISPNLLVGNGAFYDTTDLVNRHFIPDGDPVWQNYLTTKCTFEPLSAQERTAYREKYPGKKLPAGKFLIPGQKKIFCYIQGILCKA